MVWMMAIIKMTFFSLLLKIKGKMISQYNCVEYCQCNTSIRLGGAKSGVQHIDYI